MNFTDKMSLKSTSVISEPFVNRSSIVIEVACSRVPYSYFQVQVALQVGDEVGPFVSDGKTHGKHVHLCCCLSVLHIFWTLNVTSQ